MAHAHEFPRQRGRIESRRALTAVLALTTYYTVAEVVGLEGGRQRSTTPQGVM